MRFRFLVPLETPVVPVLMRREALAGRAEKEDTRPVSAVLEERVVMAASEETEPVARVEQAVLRRIAAHPWRQDSPAEVAAMAAEASGAVAEVAATAEMQSAMNTRAETGATAATAETDLVATEAVGPREERAFRSAAAGVREVGVFTRLARLDWEVLVDWAEGPRESTAIQAKQVLEAPESMAKSVPTAMCVPAAVGAARTDFRNEKTS